MIVQALVKRYDDTQKVPPGWQHREVSYALELTEEGKLLNIIMLGNPTEKKPKLTLTLPSIGKGRSGKKAHETAYFLCDDGNYLLGLDPKKFESAKKKHQTLLKNVNTPAARAICAYFAFGIPTLPLDIDKKEAAMQKYVFQVNGRRVDYDAGDCIRIAWEATQIEGSGTTRRCLITGNKDAIIRLHDKVELLGVTMGKTPFISMNDQSSFRSYGARTDDPPAQIGGKAAFAYVSTLNGLLKNDKNRQSIGGYTLIYWAEDGGGAEEETFSWTSQPKEGDAQILNDLIKSAAAGHPIIPDGCRPESRFYLLCLSPNAGRISVRFFHVDSFGAILINNITHHQRLEIFKSGNKSFQYLPIYKVLKETTFTKKTGDAAPLLGGQYMHSIITGSRYLMTLFHAMLARIRAGEEINEIKAAVVKAIMIKNYNEIEVTTVALNRQSDNKPYVLGRLFSTLEQLQLRAAGDKLNATIRDRYFASACANPGNVFPTLLKLSMHHAAKLENAVFYEKIKGDLLGQLDADKPFPSALSLDDQGRFILGYYHQTQDIFTPKKDKEDQGNV